MKKNCIVAQSGGPTAAINASLAGVLPPPRDCKNLRQIIWCYSWYSRCVKRRFLGSDQ